MAEEKKSGLITDTAKKNCSRGFQRFRKQQKNVKKVYGYFNNHYHGYAPENCLHMLEKLGLLSETQRKAKEKSKNKQAQLGSFFG